jgi:hypothetical protein
MTRTQIDEVLQWTGTACILAMYVSMNFFRDLKLDPLFGLLGGACYLAWTMRVRNMPQAVVNVVAITVCAVGLYKAFG